MKKISVLFLICSGLLSFSCKEDSGVTDAQEEFAGITYTDGEGNITGEIDPSDWCMTKPDTTEGVPGKPYMSFGPACPNPTEWGFSIKFSLVKDMRVKLYVMNSKHEITYTMYDNENLMAGSYKYVIPEAKDWPDGMYRVFFETDSLKCKGDVLLANSKI